MLSSEYKRLQLAEAEDNPKEVGPPLNTLSCICTDGNCHFVIGRGKPVLL